MRGAQSLGISALLLAALFAGCSSSTSNSAATADADTISDCTAGARPTTGVQLVAAFGGTAYTKPVELVHAAGDATRFWLVEKMGTIRVLTKESGTSTVFADLRSRVNAATDEAGLLSIALDPHFLENGTLYLSYTASSSTAASRIRSVIARAKSRDGGATLDTTSIEEIISFDQPYTNHNGGHIVFGPDGYLYIGYGDGGSAGDPLRNGQNKNTLFAKILRIDVNRSTGYDIPSDNPFASGGGKAEVFAYGLRNPWKFNFDRTTGALWAGDVGQDAIEEVDKIVNGGNYGWSEREGNRCYRTGCSTTGFIEPLATYPHTDGVSITGGYVYRGAENPSLVGQYLYGDYGSGRIWALPVSGGSPRVLFDTTGLNIASFAEDADGEVYVMDYSRGKIAKIAPAAASASGPPNLLSQSGCFVATDPTRPTSKLVPYTVNAPLWSDGADKERYFALPAGGKISVGANGDWDLPAGSITVKNFSLGTKRVETRLFMRHTDGSWAGYTYEWNDAQTDATLLTTDKTKTVGTQAWTFPNRGQCMSCHQGAAGFTLGLETAQLNRSETTTTGSTENQLARLSRLGVFASGVSFTGAAALPQYDDVAQSNEARAKSYLHANCGFCHQPGGLGRGSQDFRFSTSFAGASICNKDPEEGSLGVSSPKLFAPGAPARSIISVRMHALDGTRMPPLASHQVDATGTALIDSWIRGTTACP